MKAATAHRLLNDHQTLPDTPDKLSTFLDAEHYQALLQKHSFRQNTLTSLTETITRTHPDSLLHLICKLAFEGNTHNTIGLAIIRQDTFPHSPSFPQGKNNYIFTTLSRDIDWMGMDAALPAVTDLEILVFESYEPATPAAAIAVPHTTLNMTKQASFPQGEAATLRDLLKWHGGNPYWVPHQEEYTT